MSNTEAPSLDLAAQRTIVLQAANRRIFRLHCRTVSQADWFAFYDAITITHERDGSSIINVADFESPSRLLAERVLTGAEGYETDDGVPLTSLKDWQQLVPLAHRIKAGEMLAAVQPENVMDEGRIYSKGSPVALSAVWSGTDAEGRATMLQYTGLLHVLKAPTEAQYRRYARESHRSVVLGGKRTGTTLYPASQQILAELYDEIVVRVEGYSCNGTPLADAGPQEIARHMDTHHKVVAAQQIFVPNTSVMAKLDEPEAREKAQA